MSEVNSEYSTTSTSSHEIIERKHCKKSVQNEEQQTVVNVFSKTDPEKADKLVQTGFSTTSFKKSILFNQRSATKIKNSSNSTIIEDSEDFEQERETEKDGSKKKSQVLTKPLLLLVPPENKSMESRKCAKGNFNCKVSPDLTRKKLEAELKAAEEIAKLKENVIEKRLAFELASLEDNVDCITNKKSSPSHLPPLYDKKCMEEPPKKMVPSSQETIAQEREICYKYAFNPTRPVLPTASGCSRQHSPMAIKIARTDSTSSVLAAFKNLSNFAEKKFNFDKKFCGFNDAKCPSPTTLPPFKNFKEFNCVDSGCEMAKKHTEYHKNNATKLPSDSRNRARMIWKSAMTKIKSKMKPKTPPA